MRILNPQAVQRMRAGTDVQFFGGGSSSDTRSTTQQTYSDQRVAVQGGQGQSGGMFNRAQDDHSTTASLSDVGNQFTQWLQSSSNAYSSTDSHAVSDSGNSTNSGNTSTTLNNADSHNTQSVINYTGTDGGSVQIAQLQAQLMGAVGANNLDVVRTVAGLGAQVGGAATDLAALSQANSMQLSTHMLDLTGELIDKLATGTGSAVAAQSAISQATAQQASASAAAAGGMQKTLLIGAGLLAAALILKH